MNDYLEWAIKGIEREIEETQAKLETLRQRASEMRAQHHGGAQTMPVAPPIEERRMDAPLSAPARRGRPPKNRAAAAPAATSRRKRMDPASRAKLSEAMKKRWAERKKAQGSR